MQTTVKLDEQQAPALNYISKLTGRPIDEIVATVMEEWLATHYCETVAAVEQAKGIPSTVSHTPTGRFRAARAFKQMTANLKLFDLREYWDRFNQGQARTAADFASGRNGLRPGTTKKQMVAEFTRHRGPRLPAWT